MGPRCGSGLRLGVRGTARPQRLGPGTCRQPPRLDLWHVARGEPREDQRCDSPDQLHWRQPALPVDARCAPGDPFDEGVGRRRGRTGAAGRERQPGAHLPQCRVLVRAPHHVGVGPAQVGHADPDPMVRHLRADGMGERLHARLARAVRRHHRGGGERGQRRHLQQVALAFEQGGQECAGGGHAAEQVDLDDPRERAGVGVDERATDGDPGVGDDDVDPAVGVADRGGDVWRARARRSRQPATSGSVGRMRRTRWRVRPARGRAGPPARYGRPGAWR